MPCVSASQCHAHFPEGIQRRTKGKLFSSFPPAAHVRSEVEEQSCKSCSSATKGCTSGNSSNASIRSRNGTIKHAGAIFCLLLLCSGFMVGQTEDTFTYVDPSDPLFLGAPNVTYTGDTNVTVAFETKSDFVSYTLVLYEIEWSDLGQTTETGRELTLSTPLVASPKVLTPDDYTSFTPQYGQPLHKESIQNHKFRARIIGMKPDFVGVVSCETGVQRNGTSEITTRCSPGVGITCSCAFKVMSNLFQVVVKASAPSAVGICDILDQTVDSPCISSIWGTQQIESGNLCRRSIVAPVVSAENVCGCVLVLPFDVFCTLTFQNALPHTQPRALLLYTSTVRVYFRPMKSWGFGNLDPPSGTPFYYLIELSTTQDFSSGYVFCSLLSTCSHHHLEN